MHSLDFKFFMSLNFWGTSQREGSCDGSKVQLAYNVLAKDFVLYSEELMIELSSDVEVAKCRFIKSLYLIHIFDNSSEFIFSTTVIICYLSYLLLFFKVSFG